MRRLNRRFAGPTEGGRGTVVGMTDLHRRSPPAPSPFADMLRELYHGRSWVSARPYPRRQRIAFVVATIDLDENTTTSRRSGSPVPTATRRR